MRLQPRLRQIISLHEFEKVPVELPTRQVCGRVTLLVQVLVTSRIDKTCLAYKDPATKEQNIVSPRHAGIEVLHVSKSINISSNPKYNGCIP